MGWDPSAEEIARVQMLDADRRYEYFVKRVVDQELVWSLWSDGWALASDNGGREAVPVWPHSAFAAACARDEWQDYEPKEIELGVWVQRWLPGIKRDGRLIAVFPSPSNKGAVLEADSLTRSLREELSHY